MTHLIIHRKREYWNFVRPFKVYVDGSFQGCLKNGETRLFSVENGKHSIVVRQALSFFRSKEYFLEEGTSTLVFLETSTSWLGGSANLLLLLFLLCIGLADYFQDNLDTLIFHLTPIILSYIAVAFFVFADRYIVIRPSKVPVLTAC